MTLTSSKIPFKCVQLSFCDSYNQLMFREYCEHLVSLWLYAEPEYCALVQQNAISKLSIQRINRNRFEIPMMAQPLVEQFVCIICGEYRNRSEVCRSLSIASSMWANLYVNVRVSYQLLRFTFGMASTGNYNAQDNTVTLDSDLRAVCKYQFQIGHLFGIPNENAPFAAHSIFIKFGVFFPSPSSSSSMAWINFNFYGIC